MSDPLVIVPQVVSPPSPAVAPRCPVSLSPAAMTPPAPIVGARWGSYATVAHSAISLPRCRRLEHGSRTGASTRDPPPLTHSNPRAVSCIAQSCHHQCSGGNSISHHLRGAEGAWRRQRMRGGRVRDCSPIQIVHSSCGSVAAVPRVRSACHHPV